MKPYFKAMAVYNQQMNESLYRHCQSLSDEERKRDRQAFFRSIHGTLNHILLGDLIWLSRFSKHARAFPCLQQFFEFTFTDLNEVLYQDFHELQQQRSDIDRAIIAWGDELQVEDFSSQLTFVSTTGRSFCYDLWLLITHFFNHQTHHRGQVTTLLSQLGIDPGVTDFVAYMGNYNQNP